jgi:hypothetical protein
MMKRRPGPVPPARPPALPTAPARPTPSRPPRAARRALFALLALFAARAPLSAQTYIGFVYPAGGQQGATFPCTLGGQALDGVRGVTVSGAGVTGRIVEYNKKMNPQEMRLLQEQMRELRAIPAPRRDAAASGMIARIEKLIDAHVQQPQCDSIANLVIAELTIAKDAPPGPREIRLFTERGLSNPMAFHVGQLPEITGEPLSTSPKQILGKEAQSLNKRKRDLSKTGKKQDGATGMETMQMAMGMAGPGSQSDIDDDEVRVTPPCTVNGQIASGSVDRYRFAARRGQRLVITTQARSLVPYMADAVPGWFQPVLVLCDAQGREVAYNDDYRFMPDPVIFFEVPLNGEYILAVHDAIFRGREDFVYRITLGELPFVTSVFPLGGQADIPADVDIKGINLAENHLAPDTRGRAPGIYPFTVRGKGGFLSPPVPFAIDALPDGLESEPNDSPQNAQPIVPPLIVNGTIGTPGDRDLFRFKGRAGQELVAEVFARRLDSPLDATLKLTDETGACLALNDDPEDLGSGLNTHHADSYIRVKLPADGTYTLALGDAQHTGGSAYAYRLRVGPPQPDFELRVVPSRVALPEKGAAGLTVHAVRKDGFTGPIRFQMKDPACGFTVTGGPLTGTQTVARLTVKTTLPAAKTPIPIVIQGVGQDSGVEWARDAVAAEDRMQAFLWRHLVPAQDLQALVHGGPPQGQGKKKWEKR